MKLKALVLGVALATASISGAANATGIPVVDAALATLQQTNHGESIAKHLEEIAKLKQQYDQMVQQYQAITGGRNMGGIARNDALSIPTDWRQTLEQMQGGQVGSLANQLKSQASALDEDYYAGIDPTVKAALDYAMQGAANNTAQNAVVYEGTASRQQRLTQLANAVDSTADLKASTDLQARIGAEQAQLLNELIRVQSMNAMAENNRRIQAQRSSQEARAVTNTKY